jgi:hypothetical protein
MIKTYIHVNDQNPISIEVLSPPSSPLPINVFEKNNSMKRKNYFSTSSFMSNNSQTASGFMSNFSPNNSPTESLKGSPMPFSSVFFKHESEQHLDSRTVFSPLLPFITHPLPVDSFANPDIDFEDLILYLAYGSSSPTLSFSSSFSSNNITMDSKSQQEFLEFHKLSMYVFSFLSFFYYSLQQSFNSKSH